MVQNSIGALREAALAILNARIDCARDAMDAAATRVTATKPTTAENPAPARVTRALGGLCPGDLCVAWAGLVVAVASLCAENVPVEHRTRAGWSCGADPPSASRT